MVVVFRPRADGKWRHEVAPGHDFVIDVFEPRAEAAAVALIKTQLGRHYGVVVESVVFEP